MKNKTEVIYLIRQFWRIQEHRIAFQGQIRALKEAGEEINPLDQYYNQLQAIEKGMASHIKKSIKDEEIWTEFLKKVKGIGPLIGAGLIGLIDIVKAKHISSLWKYAGFDVVDGHAPRFQKGQKATWNPEMRVLCWKIGKSFLMCNSPYRKLYDQRKEYEVLNHPELRKIVVDRRAKRVMIKRFLSDLWLKWRELEGLPLSLPYACEKLGHKFQKSI